jgi:FAD/FMN-containing dehydrogenase
MFGDRIRPSARQGEPGADGALATVLPISVQEVMSLARVAERYSLPLVALGAETTQRHDSGGGILVRFDLMRNVTIKGARETWARAQAGASWLDLDDNLHARGWGLVVYPTSAPRATVGGWLALDGLGVGSFEYGRLHENVLSADVVLPGGELRTARGDELRSLVGADGEGGIVVVATIRTRLADADVPFAVAFEDARGLVGAVSSLADAGVPLWHLAFVNPVMARMRNLGENHLLFGAYPRGRAAEVEEGLRESVGTHGGRILSAAEAYRTWGERFFPVAPSHPTPTPASREFVPLEGLPELLGGTRYRPEEAAVQGTVARSGEVLLLTLDLDNEGGRE